MLAVLPAMVVAMLVAGAVGLAFERFIVRPVYGNHLKQILITMGGMIIGEELIKVIWGPLQIPLPLPEGMRGAILLGDAAVEKYRVIAVVVGLLVFGMLLWVLTRTKIGLLIRAGVQDREMVESLGYRIKVLFIGVFVVGSALAGLGGVMWGLYQQNVIPQMGAQVNVLIFIVLIIGGLGSTTGALVGALLVGPDGQLHGLSGPQGGAVLQHRFDDGHPAVAPAGRVRVEQVRKSPCSNESSPTTIPRSRVLAVVLVVLLVALAFMPFVFPGVKALNVAAKILVFIVLVASFDLLLGYTGIVSFAHTMFFGIGAYGIAIASTRMGAGWSAIIVGLLVSLALSFVLALLSACSRCGCGRSSSR